MKTAAHVLSLALILPAACGGEEAPPRVGSRIAFVTDRDGNDEIYAMRPDGSEVRNLTNHPAQDEDPAWAP